MARQLVERGLCTEVTARRGSAWSTDKGTCFVKMCVLAQLLPHRLPPSRPSWPVRPADPP